MPRESPFSSAIQIFLRLRVFSKIVNFQAFLRIRATCKGWQAGCPQNQGSCHCRLACGGRSAPPPGARSAPFGACSQVPPLSSREVTTRRTPPPAGRDKPPGKGHTPIGPAPWCPSPASCLHTARPPHLRPAPAATRPAPCSQQACPCSQLILRLVPHDPPTAPTKSAPCLHKPRPPFPQVPPPAPSRPNGHLRGSNRSGR